MRSGLAQLAFYRRRVWRRIVGGLVVLPLFQLLGIRSKHSGMMLGPHSSRSLGPPYGLHVPGDRILWSSRALVMCIVSLTRLSSRTAAEVTQVGEV